VLVKSGDKLCSPESSKLKISSDLSLSSQLKGGRESCGHFRLWKCVSSFNWLIDTDFRAPRLMRLLWLTVCRLGKLSPRLLLHNGRVIQGPRDKAADSYQGICALSYKKLIINFYSSFVQRSQLEDLNWISSL
jgi:hypothetical protein